MAKTDEEVTKKELSKRLKLSDRKAWRKLSAERQRLVVNKYYQLRMEDYADLKDILREQAHTRREMGLLFMGLFLGVFGSIIAQVLMDMIRRTATTMDMLIGGFFFLLTILFILLANRYLAENLGAENVIERLSNLVDIDQPK